MAEKSPTLRQLLDDPQVPLDDPRLAEVAQTPQEQAVALAAGRLLAGLRAEAAAPPVVPLGFASRVVARIPDDPASMLGWAALRLLPAAATLVLLLGWQVVRSQPPGQGLLPDLRPEALIAYALLAPVPDEDPEPSR